MHYSKGWLYSIYNFFLLFQISMKNASSELFAALDHRAYFSEITIILPNSWPSTCLPAHHHNHSSNTIVPSSGETSDVTITGEHQIYRNNIWTEQAAGCGIQGRQIYASHSIFAQPNAGREFVNQWARYRYGIFDEIGFTHDPIYPKCDQLDDEFRENA